MFIAMAGNDRVDAQDWHSGKLARFARKTWEEKFAGQRAKATRKGGGIEQKKHAHEEVCRPGSQTPTGTTMHLRCPRVERESPPINYIQRSPKSSKEYASW